MGYIYFYDVLQCDKALNLTWWLTRDNNFMAVKSYTPTIFESLETFWVQSLQMKS